MCFSLCPLPLQSLSFCHCIKYCSVISWKRTEDGASAVLTFCVSLFSQMKDEDSCSFLQCSQWWSSYHFHLLHRLGQSRRGCQHSDMSLKPFCFFKCALVSVRWAMFIYCNTYLVGTSDDICTWALLPWGGRSKNLWGFIPLQSSGFGWNLLVLEKPLSCAAQTLSIKLNYFLTWKRLNFFTSATQVFGASGFSVILEREDTSWLTLWEWFVCFTDV